MIHSESVPHQKSLVILSLGFILFALGEGEVRESISFAFIGVTLNKPIWLGVFAWVALFWSCWRFLVNNDIKGVLRAEVGKQIPKDCRRNPREWSRVAADLGFTVDESRWIKEGLYLDLLDQKHGEGWFDWQVELLRSEPNNREGQPQWIPASSAKRLKVRMLWHSLYRGNGFADYIAPILFFIVAVLLGASRIVDGGADQLEASNSGPAQKCTYVSEVKGEFTEHWLLCRSK